MFTRSVKVVFVGRDIHYTPKLQDWIERSGLTCPGDKVLTVDTAFVDTSSTLGKLQVRRAVEGADLILACGFTGFAAAIELESIIEHSVVRFIHPSPPTLLRSPEFERECLLKLEDMVQWIRKNSPPLVS